MRTVAPIAALFFAVASADAAGGSAGPIEPPPVIVSPTRVLSNDMGTYSAEVLPEKMIDHSGLDKAFTSGETEFDPYFDDAPEPFGQGYYANGWQSEAFLELPATGTLDFDFGTAYRFDRLVFWNRTLEDIRISFASDPGGPWEQAGSFTLRNEIHSSYAYRAEVIPLDPVQEARYLRVDVDSVYSFSSGDDFAYAMLGEIAASAVPVPEPGASAASAVALLTLARWMGRTRCGS